MFKIYDNGLLIGKYTINARSARVLHSALLHANESEVDMKHNFSRRDLLAPRGSRFHAILNKCQIATRSCQVDDPRDKET